MKKLSRVATLLVLLPLLLVLTGCRTIRLYPIAKQDIVVMHKGEAYTPDREGFFLSTLYMQEVMQAKVEKEKLK